MKWKISQISETEWCIIDENGNPVAVGACEDDAQKIINCMNGYKKLREQVQSTFEKNKELEGCLSVLYTIVVNISGEHSK